MRVHSSLLAAGSVLLAAGGVLFVSMAVPLPVLGATAGGLAATPTQLAALRAARAPSADADVRYRVPVSGRLVVLRPFRPPPTRYGPGHRGVDLAVGDGVVRAAAPGRVIFAGRVVDRGVVVLAHADGVRTEYEPVAWLLSAGRPVAAGEPIAQVSGLHPGCPASVCLHWGARYRDDYFDPLTLLKELGVLHLVPSR